MITAIFSLRNKALTLVRFPGRIKGMAFPSYVPPPGGTLNLPPGLPFVPVRPDKPSAPKLGSATQFCVWIRQGGAYRAQQSHTFKPMD